jgi:hypothetical protein
MCVCVLQCGKLEPVSAFDGVKRSCRVRLAKRRDKTAAATGIKLSSVLASVTLAVH